MKLKGVLFDMDGTVVDSVPAWHLTFNDVLRHTKSTEITYEMFCRDVLGQSSSKDIELYFPRLTEAELLRLYDRFFVTHIKSVRLFPETISVLDGLKSRGLKIGLVTNTPRELMELTLDTVGLKGHFDVCLGGDDVSVGKPDPQLINKALKTLMLKPSEAVMVGDTQADMGAGKNAGCKTIGINTKGDYTIKKLGKLQEIIERF